MSQPMCVYKVFTPSSPARVNFVPRQHVNDDLADALRTPGKQVVVFGESGSGKSSLLEKKLSELYPNHVTTRCHGSMSFDQLLLDAFDQLDEYYVAGAQSSRSDSVEAGIAADFMRIRATMTASAHDETSRRTARVIPPQLTPARLAKYLGAKDMCWVLEDFHKVPEHEKVKLSQTLKIFADASDRYPVVKIVAVGATETAREVVKYDREMRHRVAEIAVPLMSDKELEAILTNGQQLLNVDFTDISQEIVTYSCGLAAVCHQLALNACLELAIVETVVSSQTLLPGDLDKALKRYVRSSSDTLNATFDIALRRKRVRKYDNTRLILERLAEGPVGGMNRADLLIAIRTTERKYPQANLTRYLSQLTSEERGSLLRIGTDGRIKFADPLHHVYAQAALLADTRSSADDPTWGLLSDILFDTLDSTGPGIERHWLADRTGKGYRSD